MSAKDLKALERRLVEGWNKGKAAAMAVIDETCATNVVVHGLSAEDMNGLEGLKKHMNELYIGFPDLHFTIGDMIAEGDKVAMRGTTTGTHKGAFMGIPPTNKRITWWGIEVDRIVGGKVVEIWALVDAVGLMQQLGVMPTLGKGK
jgi:predicted ester cyclase